MDSLFTIILTFYIIADPIGNSPAIMSVLKSFSLHEQKKILLRESLIAFIIAIFFQFLGNAFLTLIDVSTYSVELTGGVMLFIISLEMLFPQPLQIEKSTSKKEPYIVPIATPLISGPGLLVVIMLYSNQLQDPFTISLALTIAWIGITCTLIISPYLQKLLKEKGMSVLERLTGLIVCLIATEMIISGTHAFIEALKV